MQTRLIRLASEEWHLQHGYALIDRKLVVNEEEAVAIRTIFDQYVNTELGAISDGVNVSVVLDCGFGNTSKRK